MKCITDNKAAAKTAVAQIGVGAIIAVVSLISKSVLITIVGLVIFGLGVRGIMNICKAE